MGFICYTYLFLIPSLSSLWFPVYYYKIPWSFSFLNYTDHSTITATTITLGHTVTIAHLVSYRSLFIYPLQFLSLLLSSWKISTLNTIPSFCSNSKKAFLTSWLYENSQLYSLLLYLPVIILSFYMYLVNIWFSLDPHENIDCVLPSSP